MIPTTDLEAMLERCEKVVAALQAMKKFKGNNHERALGLTKKWMAASDERLKDDEVLAVIRDLIAARKVVEAAKEHALKCDVMDDHLWTALADYEGEGRC